MLARTAENYVMQELTTPGYEFVPVVFALLNLLCCRRQKTVNPSPSNAAIVDAGFGVKIYTNQRHAITPANQRLPRRHKGIKKRYSLGLELRQCSPNRPQRRLIG